jgi:hypothetical protein
MMSIHQDRTGLGECGVLALRAKAVVRGHQVAIVRNVVGT